MKLNCPMSEKQINYTVQAGSFSIDGDNYVYFLKVFFI